MAYGNRLLDRLPSDVSQRLFGAAELTGYHLGDRIDENGRITHALFPVSAVISLLTTSEASGPVELATVGSEGFIGVPLMLGRTHLGPDEFAQAQMPGSAWRVDVDAFLEVVNEEPALRGLLLDYVALYQSMLARQVLCNLLHPVEQRVGRWLLVSGDRAGGAEFPLTQEFLSEMLGVRRATVNAVQQELQEDGLIGYSRGRVRIIDRQGLAARACACYAVIEQRTSQMLD